MPGESHPPSRATDPDSLDAQRHDAQRTTSASHNCKMLVTLAEADVAEVGEALARYEQEKAELDRAAEAGLAALQQRLTARRAGGQA
jgi:hypothetical protein